MEFKYSDITIILNDKEYKVHKIMLIRLPFFNAMFNNFKESNDKVIVLTDDVNSRCWEKFLTTIYNYKEIKIYDKDLCGFDEEYVEFCNYMGLKEEIDSLHDYLLLKMSNCDILENGSCYIEYIMKNRELRLHLFDFYAKRDVWWSIPDKNSPKVYRYIKRIFRLDQKSVYDDTKLIHKYKNYPLFMYYGLCFMDYNKFEYSIKDMEKELGKTKEDILKEGYNNYFKDEIEDLHKSDNKYDLNIVNYMDNINYESNSMRVILSQSSL